MTINLKGLDLSGAPAKPARETSAAQSPATASQESAQQPRAEVTITSTAALLARLQQTLAAQPAVDQGRVETVSRALAAGSYHVDAGKIAQALVHTERALGQLTSAET